MASSTITSVLAATLAIVGTSAASAAGDAQRGARVFKACVACHTLEQGRHLTGPSLHGIWGREAGSDPTYHRYSEALRQSDVVWRESTLDAWLRDPQKLLPGNQMQFAGLANDAARADLIAFLKAAANGNVAGAPKPPAFPDLKKAPPAATIASIRQCGDSYFVTNAAGETVAYWEFNLRFKTDTSRTGPAPGKPVMVGQGMQGDRAQVVFASVQEMAGFIRTGCGP